MNSLLPTTKREEKSVAIEVTTGARFERLVSKKPRRSLE